MTFHVCRVELQKISSTYSFVKKVKAVGVAGISSANLILYMVNFGVSIGMYNLKSADKDGGNKGAYIFKYGDNNVFIASPTSSM